MRTTKITKQDLNVAFESLFSYSMERYNAQRWFSDDEKTYQIIFNNYIDKLMEYICQNVNEIIEKNTMNIMPPLNKRNEERNVIETAKQPKIDTVKQLSEEKKLTMWAAIEQGTLAESVPE